MEKFFMPYKGSHPATVMVNGHRLVLLAHDPDLVAEFIDRFGGDTVLPIDDSPFISEDELVKNLEVAADAKAVLPPPDSRLEEVMEMLQQALPWVQ